MNENFILFLVLYSILGLVIGSFANVIICRVPLKESISFPPSHCPTCCHKLAMKDLIPVFSWLFLKGKCRYCGEKISIQYPIIESIYSIMFVFSFVAYGVSFESIVFCMFFMFLIPIIVIDFKHLIIPNVILLSMLPFGIALAIYHSQVPVVFYSSSSLWDPIFGAIIGSGILFMIALLGFFLYRKKEVMGLGDVKLLIILGLLIGFSNTLWLLFYAVIMAGFMALVLILSGAKKKTEFMAFGPYLILSFFLVVIQTTII